MRRALRVVVADDNPKMLAYFRETLEELGHRVVGEAKDGRELVKTSLLEHPDLVITDIRMPLMDGIEAAREIYKESAIPVILISAYDAPELMDRAERDHIMAYLVKPIKSEHLETAIGIAIRRFEEFRTATREAADLRQALEDRKIIERAKGILMDRANLEEEAAFKRLQDLASNKHQKMVEIAKMILTMRDAFDASNPEKER